MSFIVSLDKNNSIFSRTNFDKRTHYNDKSLGLNFGEVLKSDLKLLCSNTNKGQCCKNSYQKNE